MKTRIVNVLLLIFLLSITLGCSEVADVEYVEGPIGELDSTSVYSATYDKDGNKIEEYFNPKHYSKDKTFSAGSKLNDSVLYQYKIENNKKVKSRVFKYSLSKETYSIDINNDSIRIGETFIGNILLDKGIAIEEIENRDRYIIDTAKTGDFTHYTFSFIPKSTGLNKFSGSIKTKNRKINFEYNYIVFK